LSNPCCQPHPGRPTAAASAPSVTATAWPRWCTWPAPPPPGPCCPPRSLAAAWPRPPGVAWTSGPPPACSTSSTSMCWTGSGWPAGWTGRAPAWTRPACVPSVGDHVGANPVDRGKPGSKFHLVSDRGGLPLTAAVTADSVNDTSVFAALLDDVPAVLTPARRRRSRPGKVDADKAYDSAANRAWLRRRGIAPRVARRGVESSARLGRHRWVVERTLSWLSCYRRLGCGGTGLQAVVLVRAAGLCACLLQAALTRQQERNGA
jgi:transposase